MPAILCHNPKAGRKDHAADELVAALNHAGVATRYCSVKSDASPGVLREATDLVIAAGGDGTVAKVIKSMPDRSVPIGIVPLGTSNNIARSLGIGGDPSELAESIRARRLRPFDVGVAEGAWGRRTFVEAIGLGPLAEIVGAKAGKESEGAARIRAGRHALAGRLAAARPIDVTIAVDGRPLPGRDWLAVEVANLPYTGPGLPLPAVDPGDGLLCAIAISRTDRDALLDWVETPRNQPMPVAHARGREIELTWNGGATLRVDDDAIDPGRGTCAVRAVLEGPAVKVFVPDRSAAG